ncbi:GlxA family transcriptional regulator [Gammaproteobacteria bacterium]|nr:GlxA family transcriptional regulator [Gammaproteobacteria bacterium]
MIGLKDSGNHRPFDVVVVVLEGLAMMSLTACIEPMRAANRISKKNRFSWRLASIDSGEVEASNGVQFKVPWRAVDIDGADLVMVIASSNVEDCHDSALFSWLRRMAAKGIPIGAGSAGTLLLARAGLLDEARCTIHWEDQERLLQEFPEINVSGEIFNVDDRRYTAAGGIAIMDLMLAIIGERHGEAFALDVAEQFIHGPLRSAHEKQRTAITWRYGVRHRGLGKAILLMEEHIAHPMQIEQICAQIGISVRHLERLFRDRFDTTPARFYLRMRLKNAYRLLSDSSLSLAAISEHCGFGTPSHFGRAFRQEYGNTPATIRQQAIKALATDDHSLSADDY